MTIIIVCEALCVKRIWKLSTRRTACHHADAYTIGVTSAKASFDACTTPVPGSSFLRKVAHREQCRVPAIHRRAAPANQLGSRNMVRHVPERTWATGGAPGSILLCWAATCWVAPASMGGVPGSTLLCRAATRLGGKCEDSRSPDDDKPGAKGARPIEFTISARRPFFVLYYWANKGKKSIDRSNPVTADRGL